jgi:Zn-dependent protease
MNNRIAEQEQDFVERLLPYVQRVMQVEDVSSGGKKEGFAARFRGRLTIDSQAAYDRLEPQFRSVGTTLFLHEDEGRHVVLAVPGLIDPSPSNPWINLLMFLLTLASVLYVGVLNAASYNMSEGVHGADIYLAQDYPLAIVYAGSILSILLAHEFGHYLAARFHRTAVTLPYFIPFPTALGTMGAFIRLKEPPRNKRVLLDIGLAGPIAGLVVAIPILLIGLSLSNVGTLPAAPSETEVSLLEGNSLLYLAAKYVVTGQFLPAPLDYGGVAPALYWARYILIGMPIPYGGHDVMLHPMAWAGWAGLLVTALNLIPAGQLDGGHVANVLFGRRVIKMWPYIVTALCLLGLVWTGWFIWAALIFFLGRTYARPCDSITPLDTRRRVIAIFGLILFVLVFIPIPLQIM